MCIRYRGNDSTKPLPSNDKGTFTMSLPSHDKGIFSELLPSKERGIFTEQMPINDKGTFNEPLPNNDNGDTQTQKKTATCSHKPTFIIFNKECRLKRVE
jgi:hypothetical protein